MIGTPVTVGEMLSELLPRLRNARTRSIPRWPADVFGLMATLVQRAGLYGVVLTNWPPADDYYDVCVEASCAWRSAAERGSALPREVLRLWRDVTQHWNTPIPTLVASSDEVKSILTLMAIADECGAGLGGIFETRDFDEYTSQASSLLENGSLCEEIHPSRLRVLPKRRTPPSGMNIRSLSLHLACTYGCEVTPQWVPLGSLAESPDTFNLIVIPFPFEVQPLWFKSAVANPDEAGNMDSTRFGFFTTERESDPNLISHLLNAAISEGKRQVGQIHMVLFPELALTLEEHAAAWKIAEAAGAVLMAGVGVTSPSESSAGTNTVYVSDPSFGTEPYKQSKHHRWRLDRSQILTYQLGATLNPSKDWWEYIAIRDRRQHFFQMARWLLIAPLICEDLARPDPTGDVIRSIGPDLVIAFLMDGPQLANRWPARYATVLAEDPGCSVLTITSLGMALLSRPPGATVSRKIASWKDPVNGLREIEVNADKDVAVVLTLNQDTRRNEGFRQVSADGRTNAVNRGFPILSRWSCIKLGEEIQGRKGIGDKD